MIQPRDFSHLSRFPGEHGNPFDVLLHRLEKIQSIPSILFLIALTLWAFLVGGLALLNTAIMLFFFLWDWLLLALLPRLKLSFGPDKPVVVILVLLRSPFALLPMPANIILQIIGTLLILYAFYYEPFRLVINRQQLITNKIAPDARFRIAHLGDLHMERVTHRERAILNFLDQEKPDIILFSGDILNLSYLRDPEAHQAARDFLSKLRAPLGVFVVSGSPAVDLPEILPNLTGDLPLRWLRNEIAVLHNGNQDIRLIGLTCSHRPHQDEQQLKKLIVEDHNETLTILLYHTPDLAPHAALMNVDLQLSGHTHGGQFRLPGLGALFTGSLYGRRFQHGRYQLGKLTLFITRGIGMEGAAAPRMRFLCPPEIIICDVLSDKI